MDSYAPNWTAEEREQYKRDYLAEKPVLQATRSTTTTSASTASSFASSSARPTSSPTKISVAVD
jgi:hypothetical protein